MKNQQENITLFQGITDFENGLKKTEQAQDDVIQKLRSLIENGDIQAFLNFQWPVVVFDSDGEVVAANSLLCSLTGIKAEDVPKKKYNILAFLTTKNWVILDALDGVMRGETMFLKDLVEPLCMFSDTWYDERIPQYTKALFFPLSDTAEGKRGAAVFLK